METLLTIWEFAKSNIEPFFSLLSFIFIFWIWLTSEFGRKWRYKNWLNEAKRSVGSEDAVLIIDLNPNTEIATQVTRFINKHEKLQQITDDKIIKIEYEGIDSNKVIDFRLELADKIREIQRMGVTRVHLFYSGPVTVSAIIGAEMGNGIPTHLYYLDREKGYCDWGTLKVPLSIKN